MDADYVSFESIQDLLTESGYICLGHGIGRSGDSDAVVDSIFNIGLRTKDNSLYFTTIILSTPTPELIQQYQKFNLPTPTLENVKHLFNNWPHQNSKKIIIARIPVKYINYNGDRTDIDGEMYRAFYIEKKDSEKITYYLDPKFIIGCFDVDKQMIRLNKNFENQLSEESIETLKTGYKIALEKTHDRLERTALSYHFTNNK